MAEGFDWDRDFRRLSAEESLSVRDLVIQQAKIEHAALQEMVERMLTSPERCGVAVVITHQAEFDPMPGEPYRITEERNYCLDPHVPFGHVWEFPSMEAYELWYERGCPLR